MGKIEKGTISRLAEAAIADTSMFVGEIKIKPNNLIFVILDGDDGVTVADCIKVSRYIESHLDREEEDFELQVSSFGIGQPLKLPRQYKKNIGRKISIETEDGNIDKGRLIFADDQKISIEIAGKKKKDLPSQKEYLLSAVKKAKIEIEFNNHNKKEGDIYE
ncbi:MAG: ribosome assembly cofactor RimP [Bacteroidales bacterium]|jgi:ribosome maturation factor RimP|nr:ribosome assembly cofactor RimP [Bacteroidales bacterium]